MSLTPIESKNVAKTFASTVVGAATQGASGAIIGAFLASVTDPVTNRLLVKRMTLAQAIADVDAQQCYSYFKTTLPTNFIKFPLFEVLNEISGKLDVHSSLKGVITGVIFTTATLPLTNYRYVSLCRRTCRSRARSYGKRTSQRSCAMSSTRTLGIRSPQRWPRLSRVYQTPLRDDFSPCF